MYFNTVRAFLALLVVEAVLMGAAVTVGGLVLPWLAIVNSIAVMALAGGVVVAYFKILSGDWETLVDTSMIDVETIAIPMADGWNAFSRVMRPKAPAGASKRPAVIVHHGLSGNGSKLLWLAVPLAMTGHVVMVPDARAHGESVKANRKARKDDWFLDENTGIIPDARRFVDACLHLDDVDPSRIAMVGHSMGGMVCLTAGLSDPRVKLVIPMSPLHSFDAFLNAPRAKRPFSEEWFMKHALRFVIRFKKLARLGDLIAPRAVIDAAGPGGALKIRLVHCKDDELLTFEDHGGPIAMQAGLPPDHVLFLERGGHALRGQETSITTRVLSWLSSAL